MRGTEVLCCTPLKCLSLYPMAIFGAFNFILVFNAATFCSQAISHAVLGLLRIKMMLRIQDKDVSSEKMVGYGFRY